MADQPMPYRFHLRQQKNAALPVEVPCLNKLLRKAFTKPERSLPVISRSNLIQLRFYPSP